MNGSEFVYPTTRYSGSKRRSLGFIREHLKGIRFESALDVFGGTATVSLMLKRDGKRVHYNDLLRFNTLIGRALIENSEALVAESDVDQVLRPARDCPRVISRNFSGMYYLDHENEWLDNVAYNLSLFSNRHKQAILMAALFQACLAKRPFNLFHRTNLNIRTRNVARTFGNKTTWERPFEELFRRYVREYNAAVLDNGQANKVVGGYDAFQCPNGVDLVYLDPPYYSGSRTEGTNYLVFYHFLEGLADYEKWEQNMTSRAVNPARRFISHEIEHWSKRSNMYESFKRVIERFQDNIIVLSYRDHGIPDSDTIRLLLSVFKKRIEVFSLPTKYALSKSATSEILFVAR